MSNNPFNYMVDQPDHDITPKLTPEFAPWYLLALAAQDRAEKRKKQWQHFLNTVGSWIVSMGLHLKHAAHPFVPVRHISPRPISIHNYRSHRRR